MAYKTNKLFYSNIFDVEKISYYQKNIIHFVYDIIFQNKEEYSLSKHQKDFLLAVQDNKRVAAKSGKGAGKTSSVAFIVIWFLCCYRNPKVICTAPSFPTLNSALWPEVSKWLGMSLVKDIFEHTNTRMYLKEAHRNWWAEPRTAKEKENIQGLHEDNMLIIIDEASGLKHDIFDALDTTLTRSNNKLIMIGNPTQVSGPFFDAFNKYDKKWTNLTFNSEESPFVTKEQIDYYAEKYGTHHDLYLVNIKGEFPSGSPNAFLRLGDIHKAVERYYETPSKGNIEMGLDVARFGDDQTVLFWRHGLKVYPCKTLMKNTIPEASQLVIDTVEEIRKVTGYTSKIRVKVDDSAVGGGVTDILKEDREHNIEVIPCNFGGKGDDKYQNEASIMWGNLKDHLPYIGLPDDVHLVDELSARRWRISPSGKIMIEPKSEFKKEFKSSPDRADALILCFANKQNEQLVLKHFDSLDPELIQDNISYIGEEKYCGVYYSKDLTTFIIYTAWDGQRLYVYDEYIGDDSIVSIAINIEGHGDINKIIGNSPMFSLKGDDIAMKFRKFGITIHENYQYNEMGAIESLSNMIMQKRIVINNRCKHLIDQLQNWKIGNNKVKTEKEFGLCYTLCLLGSELKRKMIYNAAPTVFKPYSGEKEDILTKMNKKYNPDSWMAF